MEQLLRQRVLQVFNLRDEGRDHEARHFLARLSPAERHRIELEIEQLGRRLDEIERNGYHAFFGGLQEMKGEPSAALAQGLSRVGMARPRP